MAGYHISIFNIYSIDNNFIVSIRVLFDAFECDDNRLNNFPTWELSNDSIKMEIKFNKFH